MKKLSRVFLVCLCSFLFIVNVKAATYTLNTDTIEGLYSSFYSKYPSFNKDNITNLCNTLHKNNLSSYPYYTCSFLLVSSSSGWYSYGGTNYTPKIVINSFTSDITLKYSISSSSFSVSYTNFGKSRGFWLNNTLGIKQTDSLSSYFDSGYNNFSNGTYNNNMPLWLIAYSNLTNQYYEYDTSSSNSNNLNINGFYFGYSYKSKKVYFTDLYPKSYLEVFPSEQLNDKGTYNNSNVITYKINDEVVGNNKELKIKFTFLNQLDVNANDIEIYKYGSQVYTQILGLTCENSSSDTICEFNFKFYIFMITIYTTIFYIIFNFNII